MITNNGVLSQQGLYLKYIVSHSDGSPVEPDALYFVLRYDEDSEWCRIGRETLWAMCKRIEKEAPSLVADIRARINQIGLWRIFSNDYDTFVAMDIDDLLDVYKENYGQTMIEMDEDLRDWSEIDVDRPMTIWCERDNYNPEDSFYPPDAKVTFDEGSQCYQITSTGRAWAKANGRGFLCSTEY